MKRVIHAVAVFLCTLFLANLSWALMVMDGGRIVFPTIEGDELSEQISILRDDTRSNKDREEAVRLIGGAPPHVDALVLPILIDVSIGKNHTNIRVKAIEGLGNLATATNVEQYRSLGGELDLDSLRGRAINVLISLTNAPEWELVTESANQLGRIWPSTEKVVVALTEVTRRKYEVANPNMAAARALLDIATLARRQGRTEWIGLLVTARDKMNGKHGFEDFALAVSDEIVSLQNMQNLSRSRSLKEASELFFIVLATSHVILYIGLLIGARWSERCFRLLFESIWGKFSIYCSLLFRHAWSIQRWLFERYFKEVRRRRQADAGLYQPMPLTSHDTSTAVRSSDLLIFWRQAPKLWVQGRPGMGKTSLVRELERLYFCDPHILSLSEAVSRYGMIPVVLEARTLIGIPLTNAPEDWLLSALQRTLASWRISIKDVDTLRALISGGRFGIILDGANEVERDDAIAAFLMTLPNVPLLVTSQHLPPPATGTQFSVLALPPDVHAFVTDLLMLYLGVEAGRAITTTIRDIGLMGELKSGYDIKLIADLVKQGATRELLPRSRTGLYGSILKSIIGSDGTGYRTEALEEVAWTMLLHGERRVDSAKLGRGNVQPLVGEGQRVLRIVGPQEYEFRHDQMRAYLAARHLVNAPASVKALVSELKESLIWSRHRGDQAELWGFFAEMVESAQDAEVLWRFAAQDERRVLLQHALQVVSSRRGWQLALN